MTQSTTTFNQLILEGNLDAVFSVLNSYYIDDNSMSVTVLMLQSRWTKNEEARRKATILTENYNTERNLIVEHVLKICPDIVIGVQSVKVKTSTIESIQKNQVSYPKELATLVRKYKRLNPKLSNEAESLFTKWTSHNVKLSTDTLYDIDSSIFKELVRESIELITKASNLRKVENENIVTKIKELLGDGIPTQGNLVEAWDVLKGNWPDAEDAHIDAVLAAEVKGDRAKANLAERIENHAVRLLKSAE